MAKTTPSSDSRNAHAGINYASSKNLMASGFAIPWEDRGSIGLLPAFFKTCFGVMFKPVETLSKMRRPETTNDARIFAYGCGAIWFLAVLIHSAFAYFVFYSRDKSLDVDGQQYILNTLLEAILTAAAAGVLMPRVVSWMFYRLTAFDMTSKAPPGLVFNCVTFLMGASLIALIPGAAKPWLALSPILAGVWMFVLLLIMAISRLRVRVGAAIIGSLLTTVATAGMIAVGIYAIQFVWCTVMGKASVTEPIPLNSPNHVQS